MRMKYQRQILQELKTEVITRVQIEGRQTQTLTF